MGVRQALVDAMHLQDDSETVQRLHANGLAIANEDTMSRAIHDIYCGIMADHSHPNDKDREQARALIASLQKSASTTADA